MNESQPSSIPCVVIDNFSSCTLSNWDTMIIELSIGGILASIFFLIQHRNSKLINMMLKGQFDYVVKDSINKLLWMENGLENIHHYLVVNSFEKINKIIESNSKIINEVKITIDKHKDISPQLFAAVTELKKLNDNVSNIIKDIKQSHTKNFVPKNDLIEFLRMDIGKMSSIIENANMYNIKKHGPAPYPEYVRTFVEKTHFQLSIPRIQTIISFVVGIVSMIVIFPQMMTIINLIPISETILLDIIPLAITLIIIVFIARFVIRFSIRF